MTPNTPNSTTDDVRAEPAEDNLDRLLSDFFKAQMKQPWPAAPTVSVSEPSVLVAARTATTEMPRNQPAPLSPARDTGGKSRYTLAASVALLLGTCWYLSNGFQPGEQPGRGPAGGTGLIEKGGASNPAALEHLKKDKALGGDGIVKPKVVLD
jgi:hypothetical protein